VHLEHHLADNVILIDWSHLVSDGNYFAAVENAKVCSTVTADFIEFLIEEGVVDRENIYLIGQCKNLDTHNKKNNLSDRSKLKNLHF